MTIKPKPAGVRYNDWHRVDLPALESFVPEFPVSVVIPYRDRPQDLALVLASLEKQTYPRELFEVVVVDDGSLTPFEPDPGSPISLRTVRQQRRRCGIASARNLGVRSAASDIIVLLDCDMVVEAEFLAAHARWHHFVEDALTVGLQQDVETGWLSSESLRTRRGSVKDLLAGRRQEELLYRQHLLRTRNLTSRHEDLCRVLVGGNIGFHRPFYNMIGGMDETFDRYGGEDTEFAYRADAWGALIAFVPDALVWHQGLRMENLERRAYKDANVNFQRAKLAHLIPHEWLRDSVPGRCFQVPMHVVRVTAGGAGARRIAITVDGILADPEHDLVVWLEKPDDPEEAEWLRNRYGPDPRVRLEEDGLPLEAFPTTPLHLTLPGGVAFRRGVVRGMRRALGGAVLASARLADGSQVSVARGWALHRARRTGRAVSSFGDERRLPVRRLGLRLPGGSGRKAMSLRGLRTYLRADLRHLFREAGQIRGPASALSFVRWLVAAAWWRWRYWRARSRIGGQKRKTGM